MRTRTVLVAGAATVVLAGGSVGALAATRSSSHPAWSPGRVSTAGACSVPSLPGSAVSVVLGDKGAMMGNPNTMGGYGMAGRGAAGWMVLQAAPQQVSAGTVSITAFNRGTRTHELVVLPLAAGATAGSRAVGADDTVSEQGSLGEASKTCGAGAGDGIQPGSAGWVSLTLKPGRYELICNLPGHYAAGMYAELDVVRA